MTGPPTNRRIARDILLSEENCKDFFSVRMDSPECKNGAARRNFCIFRQREDMRELICETRRIY